jgi:RNA polymerase sigma-70 factor (ECF subfamily)
MHSLPALLRFFEDLVNSFAGASVSLGEHALAVAGGGPSIWDSTYLSNNDADESGERMGAAARRQDQVERRAEDAALVERVVQNDQSAYKILVERYQGKVYAVAYGVLHNREDAREVTQEAFIKAYRNLPSFRRDSSFYTWLYRITVNLSIDFRRKAYRGRETSLDETRITPEDAHHTGPRPLANPSQNLHRKQLGARIHDAIESLPDDQRTAIVLREIQGLSYKEIAETVGCAEGTVMSRLYYGRKKLQSILRDER